ncbi:hypothetical protein [Paenibacillus sp. y28]|uniref:hypothetical protein n=1 Tax=Paenibacillus sp. y28 TaxID=3129110 RepID=UPI00301B61A0
MMSPRYTIVLGASTPAAFDDLAKAMHYFYTKASELTEEFIEFYEDNRLLLSWIRGKGLTMKRKAFK